MAETEEKPSPPAKLCPLCGKENACAVNDPAGCWCMFVKIPRELLEAIPAGGKSSCVCRDCVEFYRTK